MIGIICCICGKIRNSVGEWGEGKLPESTSVSYGYCPSCALEAFIRLEVPLLLLVCRVPSDLDEAELEEMPFVPELTDSGFVLKFLNGMEIGLRDFRRTIFYHTHVPALRTNFEGMAKFLPQEFSRGIYNRVIDLLLAAPPAYKRREDKS